MSNLGLVCMMLVSMMQMYKKKIELHIKIRNIFLIPVLLLSGLNN